MAKSLKTAKSVSAKKSAPKSAKKSVAKTATAKKVETKRPEWMGKPGTKGCDVNAAIKLMQRKQGCTRADLNDADFRQPAMSALNVARNRGYKVNAKHTEGERTIYLVSGKPAS